MQRPSPQRCQRESDGRHHARIEGDGGLRTPGEGGDVWKLMLPLPLISVFLCLPDLRGGI